MTNAAIRTTGTTTTTTTRLTGRGRECLRR